MEKDQKIGADLVNNKALTNKVFAEKDQKIGADLVVDTLINQNVEYILGIPGAKIDRVFETLQDRGPKLIVTRHEQNAVFIAQAIGRITRRPGVVLVTSGPGVSNLATGLVTATIESDPVVAIAANVQREDLLKNTHQAMDNQAMFAPIAKFAKEVVHQNNISEVITDAFRVASAPKSGAAFVSLTSDILNSPVDVSAIDLIPNFKNDFVPSQNIINKLKKLVSTAKLPVFLLGMRASTIENAMVIREFLTKYSFPIIGTFQAAGTINRQLVKNFFGRVGLFKNQPGDELLDKADLIITVGFDAVEYDPRIWNQKQTTIVHIDEVAAPTDSFYQPALEVVGDIKLIFEQLLNSSWDFNISPENTALLKTIQEKLAMEQLANEFDLTTSEKVHPLQLITTLRKIIDDKTTVTCDVGSFSIWMARYFWSYEPRRLLFSNGMQTLGVALPWAIGAALVRPNEKVISMSGDGGFLFSSMELETAVRLKLPIVHLIWNDGSYDMVAFQQLMKYHRVSGVDFGPVDFVKYAESFGAIGLRVTTNNELEAVLKKALTYDVPVVVDILVNYKDNIQLGKQFNKDLLN